MKAALFDQPKRQRWTGSRALVPFPANRCPDCAGPLREHTFGQLPLFCHAGHGAVRTTVHASCPCGWHLTRSTTETNPRR